MKEIKLNVFVGYLILTMIAVVTSVSGLYITKRLQDDQKIQPTPIIMPTPSLYPDYDTIKGEIKDPNIKVVNILVDCPEGGCVDKQSAAVHFGGLKTQFVIKGSFSRAYLYVEAAVDYNRPLTSWDDFYFKINGVGGHLVKDMDILPVPPSQTSKYLYDLRSISYFPSYNNNNRFYLKKYNFFRLLNENKIIEVVASLSSNRPGRILREISIYYECVAATICSIEKRFE